MPSNGVIGSIGVGTCPAHKSSRSYTTSIVSGAVSVLSEGSPTATIISTGIATCGHPTIVISFSSTVYAEGGGIHRIGDVGTNPGAYTLVSGTPTVISGG